jgi:hypothetical protein
VNGRKKENMRKSQYIRASSGAAAILTADS